MRYRAIDLEKLVGDAYFTDDHFIESSKIVGGIIAVAITVYTTSRNPQLTTELSHKY